MHTIFPFKLVFILHRSKWIASCRTKHVISSGQCLYNNLMTPSSHLISKTTICARALVCMYARLCACEQWTRLLLRFICHGQAMPIEHVLVAGMLVRCSLNSIRVHPRANRFAEREKKTHSRVWSTAFTGHIEFTMHAPSHHWKSNKIKIGQIVRGRSHKSRNKQWEARLRLGNVCGQRRDKIANGNEHANEQLQQLNLNGI